MQVTLEELHIPAGLWTSEPRTSDTWEERPSLISMVARDPQQKKQCKVRGLTADSQQAGVQISLQNAPSLSPTEQQQCPSQASPKELQALPLLTPCGRRENCNSIPSINAESRFAHAWHWKHTNSKQNKCWIAAHKNIYIKKGNSVCIPWSTVTTKTLLQIKR